MRTSLTTRTFAVLAVVASVPPIAAVAPLAFNPLYDLGVFTPVWVGGSALAALTLFAAAWVACFCDVVAAFRMDREHDAIVTRRLEG